MGQQQNQLGQLMDPNHPAGGAWGYGQGQPGQAQPMQGRPGGAMQAGLGAATGQNWLTAQTPGTTASPSKDVMQQMFTSQMRSQNQPGMAANWANLAGQMKRQGGSWSADASGKLQQIDPSKIPTMYNQAFNR